MYKCTSVQVRPLKRQNARQARCRPPLTGRAGVPSLSRGRRIARKCEIRGKRPMRAPAIADLVLAVLLAGLVLVQGSPIPALAHSGHQHGHDHAHTPANTAANHPGRMHPAAAALAPVIDLATPAAVTAQLLLAPQLAGGLAARPVAPTERLGPAQARLPVTAGTAVKAQKAPTEPLHQDTCCCGSLACHAGVMAAFVTIVNPYRLGERLRPRPVLASVRATLDGIERPPRAPFES